MSRSLLSLSALLALNALVSAQSSISAQTTASLFFLDTETQPLVGSILGIVGATTTYQLKCQPGIGSDQCGIPGPFTYIQDGTSSVQYAFDIEGLYVFGSSFAAVIPLNHAQ